MEAEKWLSVVSEVITTLSFNQTNKDIRMHFTWPHAPSHSADTHAQTRYRILCGLNGSQMGAAAVLAPIVVAVNIWIQNISEDAEIQDL